MLRFSVATTSIDNPESARYAVNWAIENGFHGVEFNAPELFLSELGPEDREYLKSKSREHNLRYTHHFPGSALPGSHNPEQRAKDLQGFKSEIEVSGELGVKAIVLHPGRLDVPGVEQDQVSETDRAISFGHYVDFVKAAAPIAEQAGVMIGLENMHYNPGWVIRSHEELAESVDQVNSPAVGITFDVGHAWGSGGIEAGIEILGDRIVHVQAHDALGPEGAGNVRDQHKEIGTGLVDWTSVGELAKSRDFVVVIETSARSDDREGMARRSRDVLQRLWS